MNKNLQDHKNKCRCCFKQLKSAQKTVEISKFIEKRFQVLTGIKLVQADHYSNVICESCNSKLSEFADFRQEMTENQTSLYKFEPYEDEQESADEQMIDVTHRPPRMKVEEFDEDFQFVEVLPRSSLRESSAVISKNSKSDPARHPPDGDLWQYATKIVKGKEISAQCKKCPTIIKFSGGSRTAFLRHLKNKHGIDLKQQNEAEDAQDVSEGQPVTKKAKTIASYLVPKQNLAEIVSEMSHRQSSETLRCATDDQAILDRCRTSVLYHKLVLQQDPLSTL